MYKEIIKEVVTHNQLEKNRWLPLFLLQARCQLDYEAHSTWLSIEKSMCTTHRWNPVWARFKFKLMVCAAPRKIGARGKAALQLYKKRFPFVHFAKSLHFQYITPLTCSAGISLWCSRALLQHSSRALLWDLPNLQSIQTVPSFPPKAYWGGPLSPAN